MGHSYIVYGPLLRGATTILYEESRSGHLTPALSGGCANSMASTCSSPRPRRSGDQEGRSERNADSNYDLSRFRTLFLAGERCDPDTLFWAREHLNVPVIDHWWQTETGWAVAANCVGLGMLPVKPGVGDETCTRIRRASSGRRRSRRRPGQIGTIVLRLPLPPWSLPTLWHNDEGYRSSYLSQYSGFYLTGDAGFKDDDGYVFIMSRVDDIINVSGHRLSTGGMEEVLAGHPDVAESTVVGVADSIKGEIPVGFVVTKAGVEREASDIVAELVERVRETIGPVAAFKTATVVARLPKTRSGKILRGTIKKIADGQEYEMPATIDDPEILDEITEALRGVGYPRAT